MDLPFLDPNNPLLESTSTRLDTGVLTPPGMAEEVGVATIRTNSTTLTVVLNEADARTWAGVFAELADKLAGKSLVVATPADAAIIQQELSRPPRLWQPGWCNAV